MDRSTKLATAIAGGIGKFADTNHAVVGLAIRRFHNDKC